MTVFRHCHKFHLHAISLPHNALNRSYLCTPNHWGFRQAAIDQERRRVNLHLRTSSVTVLVLNDQSLNKRTGPILANQQVDIRGLVPITLNDSQPHSNPLTTIMFIRLLAVVITVVIAHPRLATEGDLDRRLVCRNLCQWIVPRTGIIIAKLSTSRSRMPLLLRTHLLLP